jgi:signal transduction histidine kinase
MKTILGIILLMFSCFTLLAGESDFVSNNSLVATYYSNAKNLLKSNPTECIFWADKAITESKLGGTKQDLGRCLFIKGQAFENLHQNPAAVKLFQETLKVALDYKYFDLEIDALNKLSTLYAGTGDYKSAVYYASLLHDRKDSNTISRQRLLAKTLPGRADLQKRETRMKQLLTDNSILDNHLRTNLKTIDSQGNWILFIVIGYSLIFLSFIMIRRQNKLILRKNVILTEHMHTLEVGKMELDHNRYKAEESDRLKTSFLANISHEIRTPLNAIVSFSGFLRQKEKPVAERNKYIVIIHQYSESLLALINEIFEVARIESGEIKQQPEKIDVSEFLQKVQTQYYEDNKKAVKKGLKLTLNLQPSDSICFINTYPERLKSVIIHLIENALKYSDNGKVELGYVSKNSFIEFYVIDDGKGLKHENSDVLFERFKSTDDFPISGSGALGLGLTISKNFIESMGGHIWVKNNENKGSTIFFTLPIQLEAKS